MVAHLDLSYRRHFRHDEEKSVFDIAERLGRQFTISGERAHLLLTGLSEICGAVELPVATLLGNARAVIDLDGDTLSIIAKNKSNDVGILLDRSGLAKVGELGPVIAATTFGSAA